LIRSLTGAPSCMYCCHFDGQGRKVKVLTPQFPKYPGTSNQGSYELGPTLLHLKFLHISEL